MIVSQFTLYGDTRKGRRPSFSAAAAPEQAALLYRRVIECVARRGIGVAGGEFGAHMRVSLVNDGPVTVTVESPAHT